MPKSVSTLQGQLAGCERGIQDCLAQVACELGDQDFNLSFSLKAFINSITSANPDYTLAEVTKVLSLFQLLEKILTIEKKRQAYQQELKKILSIREKKETIKRLTTEHRFIRKTELTKIPTPPNSGENSDEFEELD